MVSQTLLRQRIQRINQPGSATALRQQTVASRIRRRMTTGKTQEQLQAIAKASFIASEVGKIDSVVQSLSDRINTEKIRIEALTNPPSGIRTREMTEELNQRTEVFNDLSKELRAINSKRSLISSGQTDSASVLSYASAVLREASDSEARAEARAGVGLSGQEKIDFMNRAEGIGFTYEPSGAIRSVKTGKVAYVETPNQVFSLKEYQALPTPLPVSVGTYEAIRNLPETNPDKQDLLSRSYPTESRASENILTEYKKDVTKKELENRGFFGNLLNKDLIPGEKEGSIKDLYEGTKEKASKFFNAKWLTPATQGGEATSLSDIGTGLMGSATTGAKEIIKGVSWGFGKIIPEKVETKFMEKYGGREDITKQYQQDISSIQKDVASRTKGDEVGASLFYSKYIYQPTTGKYVERANGIPFTQEEAIKRFEKSEDYKTLSNLYGQEVNIETTLKEDIELKFKSARLGAFEATPTLAKGATYATLGAVGAYAGLQYAPALISKIPKPVNILWSSGIAVGGAITATDPTVAKSKRLIAGVGSATAGLYLGTQAYKGAKALAYRGFGRKAKVVLLEQERLLRGTPIGRERATILVKHKDKYLVHYDPNSGKYITPGGGLQTGKTWKQTAVQELFEETGMRIDPSRLKYVGRKATFGVSPQIERVYTLNLKSLPKKGLAPISEYAHEVGDYKWIAPEYKLPSVRYPAGMKVSHSARYVISDFAGTLPKKLIGKAPAVIIQGKTPIVVGLQSRYNLPKSALVEFQKLETPLLTHLAPSKIRGATPTTIKELAQKRIQVRRAVQGYKVQQAEVGIHFQPPIKGKYGYAGTDYLGLKSGASAEKARFGLGFRSPTIYEYRGKLPLTPKGLRGVEFEAHVQAGKEIYSPRFQFGGTYLRGAGIDIRKIIPLAEAKTVSQKISKALLYSKSPSSYSSVVEVSPAILFGEVSKAYKPKSSTPKISSEQLKTISKASLILSEASKSSSDKLSRQSSQILSAIKSQPLSKMSSKPISEKKVSESSRPLSSSPSIPPSQLSSSIKSPPKSSAPSSVPPSRPALLSRAKGSIRKLIKEVKEGNIFSAVSKRFSKEVNLGSFGTQAEAERKLSGYLKSTLARSGKVKKAGKVIESKLLRDPTFRRKKSDPLTIVQKAKYSLGRSGETKEIQYFKKKAKKKGKKKKKSSGFSFF